jgi:16S rRNA (uracil1498-N3)-methyltransferase
MTRRRWIADEFSGDKAALVGDHADHLVRVLRARIGQEFDIATGVVVRRGRITAISSGRVEFELGDEISSSPLFQMSLLLAIFKFDRMEWAIEKCTELGVSRIAPVIARRTDSHLVSASGKRVERWRRLALQASEQSRRAAPPEIAAPAKLQESLEACTGLQIVLSETERRTMLHEVIERDASSGITLAVGPEGGWTDDERRMFQEKGWRSASLGRTVLRAETAAIAATAILVSQIGAL